MPTQRYFLKKADRLKSRRSINGLFANGRQLSLYPIRVVWQILPEGAGLKAGFSVSRRNFKKAVDRNRVKRLLREGYRLQKHDLPETTAGLAIFFIYTGNTLPSYPEVFEKIGKALRKISESIHEQPA